MLPTEPDWADFRVILALSRGGSVAAAARALGVDGSTVSRRLAAVEAAFGACLLLRGGREFSFTPEGRKAVAAAEAMEAAVLRAVASIRAAKTGIEGLVRISTVPAFIRLLSPFPELVAATRPGLRVALVAQSQFVDLARGDADIALRMVRPTGLDLVARRVMDCAWAVFASRGYVERHGRPADEGGLHAHRLVHYDASLTHLPWFGWSEGFIDRDAAVIRVDGTEMAFGMVASGLAIGLLPCVNADEMPGLVRLFPEPRAHNGGWIVFHESVRDSARVRTVANMLADFLATKRDVLAGRAGGSGPDA